VNITFEKQGRLGDRCSVRVMAFNLHGVWSCMKFELQQMRKQGSGAIVNCSSLGGLIDGNQRGTYHARSRGATGIPSHPRCACEEVFDTLDGAQPV
jgi:NADP-dependent 3-hydroxy acid dehydrogenase YdfG